LFEILFFLLTYALIEKVPAVDYLGTIKHDDHIVYMAIILAFNIVLLTLSFKVRQYRLRHL